MPLKIGAILNTPRPPIVSICPRANSMKNMGIPAKIRVMKYCEHKENVNKKSAAKLQNIYRYKKSASTIFIAQIRETPHVSARNIRSYKRHFTAE